MTTIAWRASGFMACDSCWTYGTTQVVSATKIKRLSSGALLGQAGDNDARNIEALLDKVKDPRKLPTRIQLAETKESCMALLALPRGGVWIVSAGPMTDAGYPAVEDDDYGVWPATTMGGYAAVGSGADYALSAMDAGASARDAVAIACRRDIHSRPPLHVIRLQKR
jgi:ATP-dependent protease HslVU (ClpYQ) peptidase subunit